MKEKLKKIYDWQYFPFLIMTIVLFIVTFFADISGYNDDVWFSEISSEMSIFDFLKWRYQIWSSRVIIEFCLISLLQMGNIICRLFIAIFFSLLGVAISKTFIIDKSNKNKVKLINWIIVFLILTIGYETLIGAGIIATNVNYLFPVTLGIFSLLFVRKSILKEKISKFEYPLYLLSTIIASNMELMCAILFVCFVLSIIYFTVKEKKINVFLLILLIVSILGLANILLCPGNDSRNQAEIESWYPEFANFGIIEKIKCGVYSLITSCFSTLNVPLIIFSIIVMIEITKKYKNFIIKMISIIPVIVETAFTVFAPITASIFPNLYGINNLLLSEFDAYETRILYLLPYCIVLAFLIISTILVFKNNWKTVILILVLGAGFASKLIMGISPTVFASRSRTSFIMLCSFFISTIIILENKDEKYINKFMYFLMICAMLSAGENACGLINLGILL